MPKVINEVSMNVSKILFRCIDENCFPKRLREKFEHLPKFMRRKVVSETRKGRTALALASVNGDCQLVKYLVMKCNADIEQRSTDPHDGSRYPCTPLWWACDIGNLKMVKLLLYLGANVNSASKFGSTPLLRACGRKDYNIIRYLLEQGADVQKTNKRGETCLTSFVNALDTWNNNAADMLKLLLDTGVDPFAKTYNGYDALQIAAMKGLDTVVNELISISNCTIEKKAELNELLGVYYAYGDYREGIPYWKEALHIRSNEGNYIRKRPVMPIPSAYGNIVEFTTLEELDGIALDENAFRLQSVLICERILGIDQRGTLRCLKNVALHYQKSSRFRLFLDLWMMVFQRQLRKNSILHMDDRYEVTDLLDILNIFLLNKNHQRMLRFEELLSVFQLLASRTIEAYPKFVNKSNDVKDEFDSIVEHLPSLIGTLLAICENEQQREKIEEPIRKLTRYNVRSVLTGGTLLHLTVDSMMKARNAEDETTTKMDVVKLLLECGAHIDLPDLKGVRPLDLLGNIQQNDIPLQHYTSLKCMCANRIISNGIPYRDELPNRLKNFVWAHAPQL